MAFENWNRFLQECLKQKESEHQPPPQKNNDSDTEKEVNEIEQEQIQKVSREEIGMHRAGKVYRQQRSSKS